GDDYELRLEILPDPMRDVLLIRYELAGPYRMGIILAPHLGASGHDNTAWIDGEAYASNDEATLCLAADAPLTHMSAGYVGASDGWQDLDRHGDFTYAFDRAVRGNVALSAALSESNGLI